MFYIQFLYRDEWCAYTDAGESVPFTYGKAVAVAGDFHKFHGETTQVIDIDGEVYAQFGNTPDDGPMPDDCNDCCCSDCD